MTRLSFSLVLFALSSSMSFFPAVGQAATAAQSASTALSDHFKLNANLTWTDIRTFEHTVLQYKDIERSGRFSVTFAPDHQRIKLLKAWVEEPDGHRIKVDKTSMMIRPSAASRKAPGFVSSKTATLLFPQVEVGSKVYAQVSIDTFKPFDMGFNIGFAGSLFYNTDAQISIDAPKSLPLSVGQRDGFDITNRVEGKRRHIVAISRVRGVSPSDYENHMPRFMDVRPLFVASSFTSYQEVGRRYEKLIKGKATVTPEIKKLADKIVDGKTGKAAARALYNWVALNIRYVALYMSASDGWVPHSASHVLEKRFGDCKDYVTLLQALLSAEGIKSQPVLVKWSLMRKDSPVPSLRFNHAILYLPAYDLYVNPTDSRTPFGILGLGLHNKLVVRVSNKPDVVRTPALTEADLGFTIDGVLKVADDGTVTGTAKAKVTPMASVMMRRLNGPDVRSKYMKRALSHLLHGGTGHLETSDPQALDMPFTLSMDWKSPYAINPNAAGFLLPKMPNLAGIESPKTYLDESKPRHFPIALFPETISWHYTITPPKGQAFAKAPPDVKVQNAIGSYVAHYAVDHGVITVSRTLTMSAQDQHYVPAAQNDKVKAIALAMLNDQSVMVSLKK